MVKEFAEAKEGAQKLHTELKMKTMLLEKLDADVYKARYASFHEVKMAEGTRRHDQELVKLRRRTRAASCGVFIKNNATWGLSRILENLRVERAVVNSRIFRSFVAAKATRFAKGRPSF